MSQEAVERGPAMMATIQSVYDFLTNLAREGSSLPVQYENVHVSYGGDLYLKPSSAYTMKYGAGRIPRTIFPYPTWTPTLQNLLSDVGPLHRLSLSLACLVVAHYILAHRTCHPIIKAHDILFSG
jgi:hypothetical protein